MADYYGDQMTNAAAIPPVVNPTYDHAKFQRKYFSYTVPTAGVADTKTIAFCKLPKGARLISGYLANADCTAGSLSLGDGTTATKYLGATGMSPAGERGFANTIALYRGEILANEITLTGTVSVATLQTGGELRGFVDFIAP